MVPLDDLARYRGVPIAEIIRDPLQRDHRWFRAELDVLGALSRNIADSGGDGRAELLSEHLDSLRAQLLIHFDTEELIVFPLAGADPRVQAQTSVRTLETEHHDFSRELQRTRDLTDGLQAPPGSGPLWGELVERLREFERRMEQHTQIETEIVFPHILYGSDESEAE